MRNFNITKEDDGRPYEILQVAVLKGRLVSLLPEFVRRLPLETTTLQMTRGSAERMAEKANANSTPGERYIVVRSKERR